MGEGSLFIKLAASWPVTNQGSRVPAREGKKKAHASLDQDIFCLSAY